MQRVLLELILKKNASASMEHGEGAHACDLALFLTTQDIPVLSTGNLRAPCAAPTTSASTTLFYTVQNIAPPPPEAPSPATAFVMGDSKRLCKRLCNQCCFIYKETSVLIILVNSRELPTQTCSSNIINNIVSTQQIIAINS